MQSQEWINTAIQQKNATIKIIQEGTTQSIALLNQRYGNQANMQNASYAKEYNDIMAQQQQKIEAATQEVAKVTEVYANGYQQRASQNDGFYTKIQEYNKKVEDENTRHGDKIQQIEAEDWKGEYIQMDLESKEHLKHNKNIKDIWNDMYKNMSEEQQKELGVWLAQVSQTEMYGGKIDNKTKELVNNIIDSYDSMPKETQEAMKNAMQPMLTEMEKKEPSLFAKATGIANGILSRLKKSFDIHSPSRKMRKIFKNVMISPEQEMEKGRKVLNEKAKTIATDILKKFNGMSFDSNFKGINSKTIEKSKTIFTTPQITFNVQELDEAKLQQCFNYINNKFGSQY